MNLKHKRLFTTLILSFVVSSCVRLYNGSFAQPDFKLTQPDKLGPNVESGKMGHVLKVTIMNLSGGISMPN